MSGVPVTLIIYDVPARYTANGHGVLPSGHHRVIKKYIEAGWVERLQDSVLLVHDERAIGPIVGRLRRYNAHVIIITGVMEEYGEPMAFVRIDRASPTLGRLYREMVKRKRRVR